MDNQNPPQPAPQEISPTTNIANPNIGSSNPAQESIILSDVGYLQNVFQKSAGATKLNLTLYSTHLKIDNVDNGETIEDAPIDQIKRTSKYFGNRFTYTLYTMFASNVLVIETVNKKYKISWSNRDRHAVLEGPAIGTEVSAELNYTKNMQWIKAIQDLKHSK